MLRSFMPNHVTAWKIVFTITLLVVLASAALHADEEEHQERAKKPGFFAKGTTFAYEKPSQRGSFRLRGD